MKPSNNSANIPAHLRTIANSIFSFRKNTRSRTTSSKLFRLSAPAISVALGAVRVSQTLSSSLFFRGGSVAAFGESIGTYDLSSCSNPAAVPKTTFVLGDKVWATVTGAEQPDPIFGIRQRRFQWIAPDFTLAQQSDATSATACDPYDLPTTGPFAQAGTWIVRTIDNSASGVAFTTFVVRDPNVAKADVSVSVFGPGRGAAGGSLTYHVDVTNRGPDTAQDITISNPAPDNLTFVSSTVPSCSDPSGGCSVGSLAAGDTASFTFVYNINGGTPTETLISNTLEVASATTEPSNASLSNNSSTSVASVVNQTASTCTISCPADIDANNSPNACSAIVTFATPTPSGSCTDSTTGQTASVSCNPPSGSVFPIGATTVTCGIESEGTSVNGNACSFTVTVHDTRPPVQVTVTCPGNISVPEDSPDSGSADVAYAQPTTTGNCVTFSCDPPSGSGFRTGTTIVTCTANDSANNVATCSFTVTVTSSNGGTCTVTCPEDITQTASAGQCNAAVTYSSPTVSENCGTVTCSPASGSTFPVGTTVVTCTSSQGPTCEFSVTVTAAAAPTITTCPSNKTVPANALCEGVIPNLLNEVVATGCSVTLSQSPAAGSVVESGVVTVTITAENLAGEATCTATVTISETTPPVIASCAPGATASAGANCQAAVPNVTGGVTASDNCTPTGSLIITQSPAAGTLVGVGTTTITITVKDASNNSATCTTPFTVSDTTPPIAVCKNITVALDASGNASISAADVDNGSSDNCGVTSRTVSPSTFTCANKGSNTVTLTVKDAANNTATCQATVLVVDTILPTISCLADLNVDFDPAIGGAVVTYATPVGADNCPGAITAQIAGLASGATFPVGTTTNTFRVTDGSGNTAQCSFKVTVALTSIIGLDSVSITGTGLVNSYNSTGGYPATQGSLADVVSNGTITLGNSGRVSGDVQSTRVGVNLSGASQVTGNATAGTTVSRTGSAIVGGTITNNQLAPVITLPSVAACGTYSPNTGISGTYSYNPTTGDLNLSGINIATLANGTYCFHNLTLTNSAQLKVNGLVVIRLTGTLNASGASSITNTTGVPSNLRILSSYSGSNGVVFGNSTSAHLVIYAPNTSASISGAAPVFGTVVAKTITISNSGVLHYDTLLKSIWPELWSLISGQ